MLPYLSPKINGYQWLEKISAFGASCLRLAQFFRKEYKHFAPLNKLLKNKTYPK